MSFDRWPPYVPVAKRRAKAQREMKKLREQGKHIEPVEIEGRKIARSFWGDGWCKHLEQFSDYDNRLPRGRTYVRNGSVAHLAISSGKVEAIVNGSVLYNINITIKPLPKQKWSKIRQQCTGQIGSMLELLQGKLSNQVMKIVTDPDTGLFPNLREIDLSCDCPDWAGMCKHIAAVIYGIGARLDSQPVDGDHCVVHVGGGQRVATRRKAAEQERAVGFGGGARESLPGFGGEGLRSPNLHPYELHQDAGDGLAAALEEVTARLDGS